MNTHNRKRVAKTALAMAAVVGLTIGASDCGGDKNTAQLKEEKVAQQQLDQFSQSQPVPLFNSSQLRQNLIDIETAQANATVTTSFFFNLGVVDPVHNCPSIGFPIPGTFQLTAPEQGVYRRNWSDLVLPQLEANGVYTGDTSATTVICVDSEGQGYAHWWEGSVSTVAGPAEWDDATKRIVLTGDPTAEFSTGGE